MRSTSRVITTLATMPFVSHASADEFADDPARTRELIHDTTNRLGPDAAARAVAEAAYEYGRHPETAAITYADFQTTPFPGPRTAVTR